MFTSNGLSDKISSLELMRSVFIVLELAKDCDPQKEQVVMKNKNTAMDMKK